MPRGRKRKLPSNFVPEPWVSDEYVDEEVNHHDVRQALGAIPERQQQRVAWINEPHAGEEQEDTHHREPSPGHERNNDPEIENGRNERDPRHPVRNGDNDNPGDDPGSDPGSDHGSDPADDSELDFDLEGIYFNYLFIFSNKNSCSMKL